MKRSIFTIFTVLLFLAVKAQQPCYLNLGGLFITFPSDSSGLQAKEVTLYNKEDILKSIFGNMYFNCNGSEIKVRSFNLTFRDKSSAIKFHRTFPYNYVVHNDTITGLINQHDHFIIQLDSIKIYDGTKAPAVTFKY